MVLLGTNKLTSAYGVCRGPIQSGLDIGKLNNRTIGNIFFKLCKACQIKSMSSIPPSAFSAGRIRETQRDMKVSNTSKGNESTKFFNTTYETKQRRKLIHEHDCNLMELSPLKYNSKLMNSIWGLYNRYSPHNVKKVNDAHGYNGELQQSAANSVNKNEPVISLPASKLDKVWAAINVPQSH